MKALTKTKIQFVFNYVSRFFNDWFQNRKWVEVGASARLYEGFRAD